MAINLSIKSVPEALAERLRARAARNHRSLQGELMAIIERAAYENSEGAALGPGPALVRRGARPLAESLAARAARPLQIAPGLPRSVDIVREARDTRGTRGTR